MEKTLIDALRLEKSEFNGISTTSRSNSAQQFMLRAGSETSDLTAMTPASYLKKSIKGTKYFFWLSSISQSYIL